MSRQTESETHESIISVIVPAHNEEEGIQGVLQDLERVLHGQDDDYEILVIDDGSTDKTAKVVESLGVARLIRNTTNEGYGASIKRGIRAARGDTIVIIDADGTYPADEIRELVKWKDEYDMVVGSRVGDKVSMERYRIAAKWFLLRLANYLSGMTIPDLNSGLRLFKKKDALFFFHLLPPGFSFTTTITLAFLSDGLSIKYVPIDYHKREGRSKIRPFMDGMNFILLILRTITYFNPMKVFIPLALSLLLLALVVFSYSLFILGRVADITVIVLIVSSIQVFLFGLLADLVVRRSEHR